MTSADPFAERLLEVIRVQSEIVKLGLDLGGVLQLVDEWVVECGVEHRREVTPPQDAREEHPGDDRERQDAHDPRMKDRQDPAPTSGGRRHPERVAPGDAEAGETGRGIRGLLRHLSPRPGRRLFHRASPARDEPQTKLVGPRLGVPEDGLKKLAQGWREPGTSTTPDRASGGRTLLGRTSRRWL